MTDIINGSTEGDCRSAVEIDRDNLLTKVSELQQALGTQEHDLGEVRRQLQEKDNEVVQQRIDLHNLREAAARHEAWKERLVERLHREANDRDYCDEFDQIMRELGLPGRKKDYSVEFFVQVRITGTVSAEDYSDAQDEAEELRQDEDWVTQQVKEVVGMRHWQVSDDDVSTGEIDAQ